MRSADDEDGDDLLTEVLAEGDVPFYLTLPAELKDEGRLAFALAFCVSAEGALHPEWIAVWSTINHVLKHGEFPAISEVTRLKLKK
jgi:hypothetical protein